MDPTWILVIPALLLALYAQHKVRSTFDEYSRVPISNGMSGAQVAQYLARRSGVRIGINPTPGYLSDHYDPRTRDLNLSEPVYGAPSVAAVGVAAHEFGHALQHAHGYLPLHLRSGLVPLANLGSGLAPLLFIAGLFMGNKMLASAGIVLFGAAVVFALLTLPVEFDASRRALAVLQSEGLVSPVEQAGVKKVLWAAALTYVAAALMAVIELARMVLIANRNED